MSLIVRLQRELYGESWPPQSNQDAPDMMFVLQRVFMPYCDDDDPAMWAAQPRDYKP